MSWLGAGCVPRVAQCGDGGRGWNLAEGYKITEWYPTSFSYLDPADVNCTKMERPGFLSGHVKFKCVTSGFLCSHMESECQANELVISFTI